MCRCVGDVEETIEAWMLGRWSLSASILCLRRNASSKAWEEGIGGGCGRCDNAEMDPTGGGKEESDASEEPDEIADPGDSKDPDPDDEMEDPEPEPDPDPESVSPGPEDGLGGGGGGGLSTPTSRPSSSGGAVSVGDAASGGRVGSNELDTKLVNPSIARRIN